MARHGGDVLGKWQIPLERAVFAAAEAIAAESKRVVEVNGRTLYEHRIDLERGYVVTDTVLGRMTPCRIRIRITLEPDPFGK